MTESRDVACEFDGMSSKSSYEATRLRRMYLPCDWYQERILAHHTACVRLYFMVSICTGETNRLNEESSGNDHVPQFRMQFQDMFIVGLGAELPWCHPELKARHRFHR